MEAAEEILPEIQTLVQDIPIILNTDTGTDKILASPEGKRKRKGYLPTESVKVLRDWLYEHRFRAYPSEGEKRMLSEQTNLSFLQISNWFINARRRVLPEMLQQDLINFNQITVNQPKGKATDITDMHATNSFMYIKSGSTYTDRAQCLPLNPLTKSPDSGENILDPELVLGQKMQAQTQKKFKISTEESLSMSFPEPVSPEEYKDFSSFHLLVDAAVQKATELELQKKKQKSFMTSNIPEKSE